MHLGVNLQLAKGLLQRSLRKLKGHPPALKPRTVFRGTTEPFITQLITTCAGQQDDIGMKWRMSGGRVGPPETMNAYTSNDEHHTRTKSPTEEYRQVHLCALSADTKTPSENVRRERPTYHIASKRKDTEIQRRANNKPPHKVATRRQCGKVRGNNGMHRHLHIPSRIPQTRHYTSQPPKRRDRFERRNRDTRSENRPAKQERTTSHRGKGGLHKADQSAQQFHCYRRAPDRC